FRSPDKHLAIPRNDKDLTPVSRFRIDRLLRSAGESRQDQMRSAHATHHSGGTDSSRPGHDIRPWAAGVYDHRSGNRIFLSGNPVTQPRAGDTTIAAGNLKGLSMIPNHGSCRHGLYQP